MGCALIIVIKKAKLILMLAIVCVCVVSVVTICSFYSSEYAFAPQKKLPIYAVACEEKKVALTFDAAWGADKTKGILDILDTYGYKATFFLVGFWIDKYPDMTKEIHQRGHLVGNHSNNHLKMSKLSKDEIAKELTSTGEKIKELIGSSPAYFRPPFGDYSNSLIITAESLGIYTIQWDVDSLDWMNRTTAQITERVLARTKEGSIILFHNNSDHILEALPTVILGLQNKGYSFVRIDELIYKDNYYIDVNGVQHKAS